MSMSIRLPIAIKLFLVSIGLLLVATVPMAYNTSSILQKISGQREDDVNRTQAKSKAEEVGETISNILEKMTFFGTFLLNESLVKGKSSTSLVKTKFSQDSDFISLRIITKKSGKFKTLQKLVNENYLKSFKLDKKYLRTLDRQRKIPLSQVFAGEKILLNRSLPKGAPILTIGIPLIEAPSGDISHIAIADIELQSIQKKFSDTDERTIFLVNKKGTVVAHPKEKYALESKDLSKDTIVNLALTSKYKTGQKRYFNKSKSDHIIGAFSKSLLGLIVVSEASESFILQTASEVKRQVFLMTGIVLSVALFIIFLVSRSITKPIGKLVLVTREIAKGNFQLPVARIVNSNDEVGTLAMSFDAMLGGLRERDKVKTLFNKFHGSSIAESLLKSETIGTGGSRKTVTIFFSDIRGFTSITEKTTAEQVVAMLNEYFSTMVNVILRSGGVVDKFIGDAIMGVWGAPQGTPRDPHKAVQSCLNMRVALAELNKARISRGEDPILIGMGLHTGEAISGTIGSEERMEYTVIGDAVNLASRIEMATKALGTDLLVSEDIYSIVKDEFILSLAGSVNVKGKSEPLNLYLVEGVIEDGVEKKIETEYSSYKAEGADKVDVLS